MRNTYNIAVSLKRSHIIKEEEEEEEIRWVWSIIILTYVSNIISRFLNLLTIIEGFHLRNSDAL